MQLGVRFKFFYIFHLKNICVRMKRRIFKVLHTHARANLSPACPWRYPSFYALPCLPVALGLKTHCPFQVQSSTVY
jgi:hypothetical protein